MRGINKNLTEFKLYFVFDFNVPQIFNEKPKKGEEPVDENGEVLIISLVIIMT